MGFIKNQLLNVVEWNEDREGMLFWKWDNDEIKKGSKLIIRPGQDAIFVHNGAIEGVFEDEGTYDIESEIIPFLTTLKSFKFAFNTPFRAEVVFINTKEHLVKWGTKNAINLQAPGLPGGMPVRAFGTFNAKIADRSVVIDKLAGIKQMYTIDDVRERVVASLDQLVMQWIAKEGKDIFNLQMYASQIAKGIEKDLDYEMAKIGIGITDFKIESFSYPEEVKKMQEKAAAQALVGDVAKYTNISMADGMAQGGNGAGQMAGSMAGMQMGMMMGTQMVNQMSGQMQQAQQAAQPAPVAGGAAAGAIPKFCPNCGTATNGMKFCGECGFKLA